MSLTNSSNYYRITWITKQICAIDKNDFGRTDGGCNSGDDASAEHATGSRKAAGAACPTKNRSRAPGLCVIRIQELEAVLVSDQMVVHAHCANTRSWRLILKVDHHSIVPTMRAIFPHVETLIRFSTQHLLQLWREASAACDD